MRVPLLRCAITPAFHPRFLKYESKIRQNWHWRTTKGSFGLFFSIKSRIYGWRHFCALLRKVRLFHSAILLRIIFFFFFAEKESKSMCLSVKKRFRRQEPAVWVSERERESKENLILLNSRHDCWNFCFFPLQHHEASVFFFLSNIFWFYFCFFLFSSAIIFFVGRLFSLTYRVAALATVFFFYTALYQQLEVVYRNAPQFAAHCGCWRHRTVHPVCIIQTRLNRQRTSSVSKRKKSIFYDSGRFLLTIVFFFFFF